MCHLTCVARWHLRENAYPLARAGTSLDAAMERELTQDDESEASHAASRNAAVGGINEDGYVPFKPSLVCAYYV